MTHQEQLLAMLAHAGIEARAKPSNDERAPDAMTMVSISATPYAGCRFLMGDFHFDARGNLLAAYAEE